MRHVVAVVCCLLVLSSAVLLFAQSDFQDLPVFASQNGNLELLITAKAKTISLGTYTPEAWVYEVCQLAVAQNNVCPADNRTVAPYGGVRLQLQPGDRLRIRFINQLPPAPPDAKHVTGMEADILQQNPTNLHTHGLIVEPRRASAGDPTYGDYVLVMAYPKGIGPLSSPMMDYTDQPLDYDILIPANHPSGLFWLHPHVHGLALNQVTKGLSAMITVGDPSDYASDNGLRGLSRPHVSRHIMLKDIEVEKDNEVEDQQDPNFCTGDPLPDESGRLGSCAGQEYIDDSGNEVNHLEGKWFFTVNGQVYPTITVNRGVGEVWRIVNASASRTYDLVLTDDKTGKALPFQVVAIDGISIDQTTLANGAVADRFAGKIKQTKCQSGNGVCATGILMMPSARVEIWVSTRQADGSKSATLSTNSFQTGPAGDDWPSAKLAHVVFNKTKFNASVTLADVLNVKPAGPLALASNGIFNNTPMVKLPGMDRLIPFNVAQQIADGTLPRTVSALTPLLGDPIAVAEIVNFNPVQMLAVKADLAAYQNANCSPLPAGHKRRIYFGVPDNADFGLGYEEIDQTGKPVPGTFQAMAPFDHLNLNLCLPLGPGNTTVTERWQLVNVAPEDHNFHIHQTKFMVARKNAPVGDAGALMDNVRVAHGSDGCDGTIESYKAGLCTVDPVVVDIPFSQLGDFVYHCHILEHEDGGMMGRVRVVSAK